MRGSPFGTQIPNTGPVGVEYLDRVPFVMHSTEWRDVRDYLLRGNVCTVYHGFLIDDKQFQQLATSIKPPAALRDIGTASFSIKAWRDVREYFEPLVGIASSPTPSSCTCGVSRKKGYCMVCSF